MSVRNAILLSLTRSFGGGTKQPAAGKLGKHPFEQQRGAAPVEWTIRWRPRMLVGAKVVGGFLTTPLRLKPEKGEQKAGTSPTRTSP